jgi:hypothetical protein
MGETTKPLKKDKGCVLNYKAAGLYGSIGYGCY